MTGDELRGWMLVASFSKQLPQMYQLSPTILCYLNLSLTSRASQSVRQGSLLLGWVLLESVGKFSKTSYYL